MKALVFLELRVLTPKQLKFTVDIHPFGIGILPVEFTRDHTSGHDTTDNFSLEAL